MMNRTMRGLVVMAALLLTAALPAYAQDEDTLPHSLAAPSELERHELVRLIRLGYAEEAWDRVEAGEYGPVEPVQALYLRGLVRLALAEAGGGEADLKAAALAMMRVRAHFPRSEEAAFAGVEVGYVHARIGRADIAGRLYERASRRISAADEPAYARRLERLRAELAEHDG